MPIPAFAPVERPDELLDEVDVGDIVEEVAVAGKSPDDVVDADVAAGVVKSVDCHRIEIPYPLMCPGLDKELEVLLVDPAVSVQV